MSELANRMRAEGLRVQAIGARREAHGYWLTLNVAMGLAGYPVSGPDYVQAALCEAFDRSERLRQQWLQARLL